MTDKLSLLAHTEIAECCQVALDVVGLVDEWAARFFEELDYVNEGENGTLFAEMMREDLPQVNCFDSLVEAVQ